MNEWFAKQRNATQRKAEPLPSMPPFAVAVAVAVAVAFCLGLCLWAFLALARLAFHD
jgi:hypothetical protein